MYHFITLQFKQESNILIFKLAGVEKNNDDAGKIIQRKSNHTDDPTEVLRAEHRIMF